jgi:type II secretory pathway component PulF
VSDPFDDDIPRREPTGSPLWIVLVCVAHVLAAISVFSVMVKIVPRFERVFAHFDAMLPAMSFALIEWSRHLKDYWYLYALLLPLELIVLSIVRTRGPKGRIAAEYFNILVLGGTIFFHLFAFIFITLPTEALFDRIIEQRQTDVRP